MFTLIRSWIKRSGPGGRILNKQNEFKHLFEETLSSGNDTKCIELLQAKDDILSYRDGDMTLLHIACKYGRFNVVQYLISRGLDIAAETANGDTPLFYACQGSYHDCVQYILSINPNLLMKTNFHGVSPYDVLVDYSFKQQMEEVFCRGNNLNPMFLSTTPTLSTLPLPTVVFNAKQKPIKYNPKSRMYLPMGSPMS